MAGNHLIVCVKAMFRELFYRNVMKGGGRLKKSL